MYIIKNDDQKFKTLRHIQEFRDKISTIRKTEGEKAARLFRRAYRSHIEDLELQVKEYDKAKHGTLPTASFSNPAELGAYLIKARIAAGLTQSDLASKLGVSQPMVHKYELSEYAGCGLEVLTKVAQALGIRITLRASARPGHRKLRSDGIASTVSSHRT